MELSEAQRKLMHDITREYRVKRDQMTSPRNPQRATQLQFIMFCNERANELWKIIPLITYDETLDLYLLASKEKPGFRAGRDWADYTKEDQEALMELLGLLLGIIRQQRNNT